MDTVSLLAFLGLVALGSYIQTVSGFAIALIITGGATALGLAPVAFTANVVSFVALANTAVAVHRNHSHIDLKIMLYASAGVLILSGVGLALLHHLSSRSVDLLETLLGIVILGSGALLMLHPHPLKTVSPNYVHLVAGGFGGLLSGLLSAIGVPVSIVSTLFARRFPPPVSELAIRRCAFGLLCVLGLSLIVSKV